MISNSKLAYGNTNESYSAGRVNQITDDALKTIKQGVVTAIAGNSIGGDPRVLPFLDKDGEERALVANYSSSGWQPGQADFAVFKPISGDYNWYPVATKTHLNWPDVLNPYAIAITDDAIDEYMYIGDYDSAKIVRIDMTNDNYNQEEDEQENKIVFYQFPAVPDYRAHCASLGIIGTGSDTRIVALFNQETSSYASYLDSTLVIIDPAGVASPIYYGPRNETGHTADSGLGANAVSMTIQGGYAYVSSYGGKQDAGGNANSKLQAVSVATSGATIVGTIGSAIGDMGDFVSTVIDGSDAYVLRANYNVNYTQYLYKIYKTTTTNLQTSTSLPVQFYQASEPPTGITGVYPGVTWLLAISGSRLWVVAGDRIMGFDLSAANLSNPEFINLAYDDEDEDLYNTLSYYAGGHVNTAGVVQQNVTITGIQHPAFISRTEPALKMRSAMLDEFKKKQKK